jgi:hypothetical protein
LKIFLCAEIVLLLTIPKNGVHIQSEAIREKTIIISETDEVKGNILPPPISGHCSVTFFYV